MTESFAAKVAFIGGTGLCRPDLFHDPVETTVATPYGIARVFQAHMDLDAGDKAPVIFLPRHGTDHGVPPHQINYRANLFALRRHGVERIVAATAVGSLRPELEPGHLMLADQFLDFTRGRAATYFDGTDGRVVHTDMTHPFCDAVRGTLRRTTAAAGLNAHWGGCYVCVEGPRYETAAEIRMFRMLGGDVVGMTAVPEVVLARELGMCYGLVCIATNFAAGITPDRLSHDDVERIMAQTAGALHPVIRRTLTALAAEPRPCQCSGSN